MPRLLRAFLPCLCLLLPFLAPAEEFMAVDDLEPGMKGYGLSVFQGVRPEKFEVEIIGVLKGALGPKHDLILCKCSHPVLDDIGVVAGMSGSPVYVDGKLVGAVGYGWSFAKEAIGGITPIRDMLDVYEQTRATPDTETADAGGGFETIRAAAAPTVRLDGSNAPAGLFPDVESARAGIVLEPLASPVLASGLGPVSIQSLNEVFSRYGLTVVAGGAGGGDPSDRVDPSEIGGGYGLAIPFMTGDLQLDGVGTISYRKGDTLIAFGHPMMFRGTVAMPMAAARVHGVMRSRMRPFKLSSSLNPIGTLRQDRLSAVGGSFGAAPGMVPMRTTVRNVATGGDKTYRCRALADREFLPALASIMITESVATAAKSGGEQSAEIRYRIRLDDGTSIEKTDFLSSEFLVFSLSMGVRSDVSQLVNNPFKKVGLAEFEADIRVTERLKQARLVSMRADRPAYKPGDTVKLDIGYQTWRGPVRRRAMDFDLPQTLEDGVYMLTFQDGRSREMFERMRAPGKLRPNTYRQFIEQIRLHFPSNRAYLSLQAREPGLTLRGEEMGALPASVAATIRSACPDAAMPAMMSIEAESVHEWDFEVSGSVMAAILVNRHGRLP